MKREIILVGGGGHCLSVLDVLQACSLPVAGIVHGPDCAFSALGGFPPLGRDENLPELRALYDLALVTVGQLKSPAVRTSLYNLLKKYGFTLPVAVSPLAFASASASLGEGTVLLHQALVNAGAVVGVNCIINSKALVEHECVIGAHCHIAVGAILAGGASVGEGSFVGAGAVVREGVRIGRNCVVGMGCKLRRDLPDGEIYVG